MTAIWTKLREVNNWEAISYKTVEGITIELSCYPVLTVRFPNGTVSSVTMQEHLTTVYLYGQGYNQPVVQRRFEFTHDLCGLQVRVPITDVEVYVTLAEKKP